MGLSKEILIIIGLLIILCVSLTVNYLTYTSIYSQLFAKEVKQINKNRNKEIVVNEHALPLVDDDNRYIELQTREWIKKRTTGEPCYAVIEKDKIIMMKWIQLFKIKAPKIYFYAYHDQFQLKDFKRIIEENNDKYLIIKISHLQSNYGIIKVKPDLSEDKIIRIYNKCLEKFKKSFVCNHDRSDPPTNRQIRNGKKESYYRLYETIKPGIIIQEYFESDGPFPDKDKRYGKSTPREFKILLLGDKVLAINNNGRNYIMDFYKNSERYTLLIKEARKISALLGATLIRIDFFVNNNHHPYVPYLNEISLSPSNGLNTVWFYSKEELENFKNEIRDAKIGEYPELNKMIAECPYRDLPIESYLTDAETNFEKY
jgi:hypothetical protein